ncbi:MAG: glycosyltransferase family 2 protein [Chloroflexota bacterium]|nr:glycosyltransferase family 2 protein [Chloroflexota bacterium]MDE2947565.1 glycosyltransferase family 2 protein [Chloroflexota bacterium]
MKAANVSVVIPVYRSEKSIALVVEELARELPKYAGSWEVILVEDDGGDNSWGAIEQLSKQHAFVRGYRLMRNYGQHNALLCGIRAASYEYIVTMDDDLQHPTERIGDLLDKLAEGYDVVYGAPINERHSLLRNIASVSTKVVLQGAMGAHTARRVSAFRAFRASLRDSFADFRGPLVNIDVLLTWGTTRFVAVPIEHRLRTVGRSTYTIGKLLTHAFNMITGFSTLPLRIASLLGLLMTAFGTVIFVYLVLSQLFAFRFEVPGFTFIASLVSIFAGAQMFALGIIGEYLARMHLRIMDRPVYLVRQMTDEREDLKA